VVDGKGIRDLSRDKDQSRTRHAQPVGLGAPPNRVIAIVGRVAEDQPAATVNFVCDPAFAPTSRDGPA